MKNHFRISGIIILSGPMLGIVLKDSSTLWHTHLGLASTTSCRPFIVFFDQNSGLKEVRGMCIFRIGSWKMKGLTTVARKDASYTQIS